MTFPGRYLKERRERLGLGVRDVQAASGIIAGEEENTEFYVSAARLSQIENGQDSQPSAHKLFSIATIYGLDFVDLLCRYGVNPDKMHYYREYLKLDSTHPVSMEIHNSETTVSIPVRLDPSFRLEATQLVNHVVAQWGKVPAALLQQISPRTEMYGYVGLGDFTMYPMIRPGALLLIDGSRRRVLHTGWTSEYERPVYFIELRDAYRCAWCEADGRKLTLVPHPMAPVKSESYTFPDDAEIIGQVVGVAMRIVPSGQNRHPASER